MPLTTCAVSCTFRDAAGDPLAGALVTAVLSQVEAADESVVLPTTLSVETDDNGHCVLDLFPNVLGQAATRYKIRVHLRDDRRVLYAVVPDEETALLDEILVSREYDTPPVSVTGESAYQAAVRLGFEGTEAEWLESLEGDAGDSAYQVALADGFVGTEEEWLESLKGEPGDPGEPGLPGEPGEPGVSPEEVVLIGKSVASAGLRLGIIDASIGARAHPHWTISSYVRASGVVTLIFPFQVEDQRFLPGQRVRLSCGNQPDVEGAFTVASCTVSAGVSTTITYADARANLASLAAAAALQDLSAWTISSGWPAHLNTCLGGRLDIVMVASGGTNVVDDWGAARVAQLEAQGPFDAVLIGSGILGNAIKGAGETVDAAYDALCTLIELLRDEIGPRLILVESLPGSRDVTPTDATYTAALVLNRRLWTELPRTYPFVRVAPALEPMLQNWSPPDEVPSEDVLNGWPEEAMLASDGVHGAYPWTWVRGQALAEALSGFAANWPTPAMAMLPDTRQVATTAELGGRKHGNLLRGLWGNVAATEVAMSNPGCSGVGPAGSAMGFLAGRGTSVAVGSLAAHFEGGCEWRIEIDGFGSTPGYTFAAEIAEPALLTALNDAAVQGRYLDLLMPLSLNVPELTVLWVSVALMVTVGGVEYRLAAPQANAGQYGQAALGRAMDAGYSGLLRAPRFWLPVATYTAAALRVVVKEIPGGSASGRVSLAFGPEQRLQVVG